MAERSLPPLEQRIAAAQAWWREAGVDLAFRDEPAPWLAPPAAAAAPPAPPRPAAAPAAPEPPRMGGDPGDWPADLERFRAWWIAEPSLGEATAHPPVPPRGEAGARVMMLVPMPEAEDRETLLSGPEGRMLASLALAMELDPQQVYWAAALPRHTVLPDWDALARRGLGAILLHHVALVDPGRLIVFGNRILPLFGHDPAQGAPAFNEIEIHGQHKPVLATIAPDRLLGNGRQRAGLWQRWLEWTGPNR